MSFASELRQVQLPSRAVAGRTTHRQAQAMPTAHPFAKAFAAAGVAYMVATAILLPMTLRQLPVDASSYDHAYAVARALAQFAVAGFVPALITGMAVRQSPRPWRFRDIGLSVAAMFCLMATLQAAATLH